MTMTKKSDRIVGERPAHTHYDAQGQTWQCNSPYCIELRGIPHPDDGGPEPISIGREPWRGR